VGTRYKIMSAGRRFVDAVYESVVKGLNKCAVVGFF